MSVKKRVYIIAVAIVAAAVVGTALLLPGAPPKVPPSKTCGVHPQA